MVLLWAHSSRSTSFPSLCTRVSWTLVCPEWKRHSRLSFISCSWSLPLGYPSQLPVVHVRWAPHFICLVSALCGEDLWQLITADSQILSQEPLGVRCHWPFTAASISGTFTAFQLLISPQNVFVGSLGYMDFMLVSLKDCGERPERVCLGYRME